MISQFKLSELGEDLGLNAKLFGVGSLNEILLQDQAPLPPPVAGESQLSRTRTMSPLGRSTSSIPQCRISLARTGFILP